MIDSGKQCDSPVVLLIDDDEASREITSLLLRMSGYAVCAVADGEAAVELLETGICTGGTSAPAVILMDAQMPGLSGASLIRELRTRSRARLFAISGGTPPEEILAAADGFLMKPFDGESLTRLVETKKAQKRRAGVRKMKGQKAAQRMAEQPEASMAPEAGVADFQAVNAQVISAQVLTQLRQTMPESAVRQIYTALAADLARRIDALGAAIGEGNIAEVRRIGHAIKGGCGMAGAIEAARLGAQLEMLPLNGPNLDGPNMDGRSNRSDDSRTLLRQLRAAALALESMLGTEFPV